MGVITANVAEKSILDESLARGWTVSSSERRGNELAVRVQCLGDQGRLLFVHDPQRMSYHDSSTDSLAFVRIDLGEVSGAPDLWCITEDDFPVADPEQGRPRQVCQVAIGKTWMSVGAGVFGPSNSGTAMAAESEIWRMFSGKLLARVEQLRPGRPGEQRWEAMTKLMSAAPRARQWSLGWRAAITAAGLLVLLVGWVVDNIWVVLAGIAAGAFGLLTWGAEVGDRWLARRRSRTRWTGVAQAVRTNGAFSRFKLTNGSPEPVLLPAVGARGELYATSARVSSIAHPLRAKLELTWIEGLDATENCRVLPRRWLAVELAGPDAVLGRLPSGPREARSAGMVRWTFAGDELECDVRRHFSTLAEALGLVSRQPYR